MLTLCPWTGYSLGIRISTLEQLIVRFFVWMRTRLARLLDVVMTLWLANYRESRVGSVQCNFGYYILSALINSSDSQNCIWWLKALQHYITTTKHTVAWSWSWYWRVFKFNFRPKQKITQNCYNCRVFEQLR